MAGPSTVIKKSPAFSVCSTAEIEDILMPSAISVRFRKNATIITQECEPPGVYLVIKGRIKICRSSANKDIILEILGPGDILGFELLISRSSSGSKAIGMEAVRAYLIPRQNFLLLLEQNRILMTNLLAELCRKLDLSHKRMADIAYQPVRQRVVGALIHLSDTCREEGRRSFHGNRTDISMIAAVRRETATRIIKELERDGLIETDGAMITIARRGALVQILNR